MFSTTVVKQTQIKQSETGLHTIIMQVTAENTKKKTYEGLLENIDIFSGSTTTIRVLRIYVYVVIVKLGHTLSLHRY
jgi:hypothetical protein